MSIAKNRGTRNERQRTVRYNLLHTVGDFATVQMWRGAPWRLRAST